MKPYKIEQRVEKWEQRCISFQNREDSVVFKWNTSLFFVIASLILKPYGFIKRGRRYGRNDKKRLRYSLLPIVVSKSLVKVKKKYYSK